MSKQVKNLIVKDYRARFDGLSDAMLISIRGMKAIDTTKVRRTLNGKKIRITVVRNSLARKSFAGTGLEPLAKMLTGASALAYGGESVVEVAREIVALVKDFPGIELKGAILDGTLFEGDKGVKELSKFPTKDEAIGQVITLVVSPGRALAGQILGPGRTLGGLVKAIEAKLEKGETIAKKAS
ncbi:MAG: 50S ribosomal protein L10 [Phycisphaerae bacterium]|nr:50S ribosomal protein L10 [Phycisphaerae bacterium]